MLLSLAPGPAAAAPCTASGTLTVYTAQLEPHASETIALFERVCSDIDVRWVRNATVKLVGAIRREFSANNPAPDVVITADTLHMAQFKAEGRLFAYHDAPDAILPEALRDPDRMVFASILLPTAIIYNPEARRVPVRWADLLTHEARTAVSMASPDHSVTALNDLHTLVQSRAHGWDYAEALTGQAVAVTAGQVDVLRAVADGRADFGMVRADLANSAKGDGWPIEIAYPADGTPVLTRPAAIFAEARNLPAAKAFIDFLLSDQAQRLFARQGFIPAHTAVDPPKPFPPRDKIPILPVDADQAIRSDDDVRSRFNTLQAGAG